MIVIIYKKPSLYFRLIRFCSESSPKLEILIHIILLRPAKNVLRTSYKKSFTFKFQVLKFSMIALIFKAENYISNFFNDLYMYFFFLTINYIKTLFWAKINHLPNKSTFIHGSNKSDSLKKFKLSKQKHVKVQSWKLHEKKDLIELCQFFPFALKTNPDNVVLGQKCSSKQQFYFHIFLV